MADQPTPAGSVTPRDVIAQVIADGKSMFLNTKIEWPDLRKADDILAALAAAGYQIAEAGAVTISVDLAKRVQWAMRLTDEDYRDVAVEMWDEAYSGLKQAIAAASEPAE